MFFFSCRATLIFATSIFLTSFISVSAGSSHVYNRSSLQIHLQSPQDMKMRDLEKLPFKSSVIIYYKVPAKRDRTSETPNATTSGTAGSSTKPTNLHPKAPQNSLSPASISGKPQKQGPKVNFLSLQPVIIEYRGFRAASTTTKAMPATEPSPLTNLPEAAAVGVVTERSRVIEANLHSVKNAAALQDDRGRKSGEDETAETPARAMPDTAPVAEKAKAEPLPDSSKTQPVAVENGSARNEIALELLDDAGPSPIKTYSGSAVDTSERSRAEKVDEPFAPASTTSTSVVDMNNEAVRLTLEGRYDEAEALLYQAIDMDPNVAKFHRNLSVLYEMEKKFDEALLSARTAGKLAPESPSIFEQLCPLELNYGEAAQALDCYERFQKVKLLDDQSKTYYGVALFKNGKENEALEILEQRAAGLNPQPEALNAIGVLYFKRKRLDDAAEALKKAVELAPDVASYRYNFAVAQLALGKKPSALSQYNLLKSGSPKLARQLYKMLFGDKILFVGDVDP